MEVIPVGLNVGNPDEAVLVPVPLVFPGVGIEGIPVGKVWLLPEGACPGGAAPQLIENGALDIFASTIC